MNLSLLYMKSRKIAKYAACIVWILHKNPGLLIPGVPDFLYTYNVGDFAAVTHIFFSFADSLRIEPKVPAFPITLNKAVGTCTDESLRASSEPISFV